MVLCAFSSGFLSGLGSGESDTLNSADLFMSSNGSFGSDVGDTFGAGGSFDGPVSSGGVIGEASGDVIGDGIGGGGGLARSCVAGFSRSCDDSLLSTRGEGGGDCLYLLWFQNVYSSSSGAIERGEESSSCEHILCSTKRRL